MKLSKLYDEIKRDRLKESIIDPKKDRQIELLLSQYSKSTFARDVESAAKEIVVFLSRKYGIKV